MLYKHISFDNLNLSDAQFSSSGIVLQDFQFPLELETQIEEISLSHGQKAFHTRAKGRIYTISGRIIGVTPEKRNDALNLLLATIRPSGILGENEDKRLEWEDFHGRRFWTMARVYESVNYTHNIRSAFVDFSFSLFAEHPAYFSTELKTAELDPHAILGFGKFSGDIHGVHLGFLPTNGHTLSGSVVENAGNFEAGVKITDTSNIENNTYVNLTNGLQYGVSGRAENRVIDTAVRPTKIEDYGQIAKAERLPHSTGFLLSPGANIIVAGNGEEYTKGQITLSWYDTYI